MCKWPYIELLLPVLSEPGVVCRGRRVGLQAVEVRNEPVHIALNTVPSWKHNQSWTQSLCYHIHKVFINATMQYLQNIKKNIVQLFLKLLKNAYYSYKMRWNGTQNSTSSIKHYYECSWMFLENINISTNLCIEHICWSVQYYSKYTDLSGLESGHFFIESAKCPMPFILGKCKMMGNKYSRIKAILGEKCLIFITFKGKRPKNDSRHTM